MSLIQWLSILVDTSSLIAAAVVLLIAGIFYALAGLKNQQFVGSKTLGGQGVAQMIVWSYLGLWALFVWFSCLLSRRMSYDKTPSMVSAKLRESIVVWKYCYGEQPVAVLLRTRGKGAFRACWDQVDALVLLHDRGYWRKVDVYQNIRCGKRTSCLVLALYNVVKAVPPSSIFSLQHLSLNPSIHWSIASHVVWSMQISWLSHET